MSDKNAFQLAVEKLQEKYPGRFVKFVPSDRASDAALPMFLSIDGIGEFQGKNLDEAVEKALATK